MDEKRLKTIQKVYALALCSVTFMIVYNLAALYASKLDYVPSFVLDFEKNIPFISWTIIPYMTSGILFCSVFFFCQDKEQLKVLTKRMLFVTIIAGSCFIIFPLRFSLSKPILDNSIFSYFFYFLETFDSPFNQSPSLHIAYAFIFWSIFRNFKKWRMLLMSWLVLLGISTLTTYQHHFIDVITGAMLAQISFIIFPYRKQDYKFRNFHVANYYFLFGWIFILISFLLDNFLGSFWLILLWPAIMNMLIGYHYQTNNIYFLKNRKGNIFLYKKIFYFPYLLIYRIFWKFIRNKKLIEIAPKIYISSRPGNQEYNHLNIDKNTFVYDLSAEMDELAKIKNGSKYYFSPFLDIGTFDIDETRQLVDQIYDNHIGLSKNGKILIHCTMGYTRSTIIAILVMEKVLSLPLDEAIINIKNINKKAVIHSYLQDFLKKFNL